jgi:hypothetical protein
VFSTGEDLLETVPDLHSVELLDPDLFNCILILKKFFQIPLESGFKSFENAGSESGSAFIVCPGWRLSVIPIFHNIKFFGSGLDFIGQRIRIRIGNPGSDLDRPN